MSSGFIAAWTAWPRSSNGTDLTVEQIDSRVAMLSDEQLDAAYEDWNGDSPLEYEQTEGAAACESLYGDWRHDIRKRLHRAVQEVFADSDGDAIDTTVRGVRLVFCGGSSGGDDPNPTFRSMCLMDVADMLNDQETWEAR